MFKIEYLPSEPEQFFDLPSGYDRRELKRRYGRAIRQFAPDSHPAEFQLVREAYERLERMLRYQKGQQNTAEANQAWKDKTQSKVSKATEENPATGISGAREYPVEPQRGRPQLTVQQLALIDPANALEKLNRQAVLSPQEYYLQAVLGDAIAGMKSTSYLERLLDGLEAHPSDQGLISLVTECISRDVPDVDVVDTIESVAKRIRSPLFYQLTEPLWLRLVESVDFTQWHVLLDQCDSGVRQTDTHARLNFYLRILHAAIWFAPQHWTEQKIGEMERQSSVLDEFGQFELEYLSALCVLLNQTSIETESDPLKHRLLVAMKTHCLSRSGEAYTDLVQQLAELSRDGAAIRKAFPVRQQDNNDAWVMATQLLVAQVRQVTYRRDGLSGKEFGNQIARMLSDLQPTASVVLRGQEVAKFYYFTVPLVLWLFGGAIFIFPPLLLPMIWIPDSASAFYALGTLAGTITGLCVLFFRWFYPRMLKPRQERKALDWLLAAYRKNWRKRLFRFAQTSNQPIGTLLQHIAHVSHQTHHLVLGETVQYFGSQDAGLVIYVSLRSLM